MSHPIPKKLAADMAAAQRYKHSEQPIDRVLDDSVERAMFDEILYSTRRPGSSVASRSEDSALNNAMIKRLQAAEQEVFSLQKEILKLKHFASILHAENEELRRADSTHEHLERNLELTRENIEMKQQIKDMEDFLADYNLTWVGHDYKEKKTLPHLEHHATEQVHQTPSKSYVKFAAKVEELNAIIRSEPTQVKMDDANRKARLVHAAEAVGSIRVTYYRNGLMVKRGPFRYHDSASYKSFVRDVMDGFFPSELQTEFPDGVVIDLRDRSHVDYTEGSDSDDRLTGFQLLKRLPKQVLRNGEIIEIANGISNKLNLRESAEGARGVFSKGFIEPIVRSDANINSPSKDVVHLRYDASVNETVTPTKVHSLPASIKASSGPLNTAIFDSPSSNKQSSNTQISEATVQVKCGGGGPTFLLKLPENASIRDLRKMLKKYFSNQSFDGFSGGNIELRSAFPPRVLTDDLSMVEAGLVPNGTIHAKLS